MFSNFVDNLPKITKKQETMRNIHLEGLKNKNKHITENFDKFDYFVHPIVGADKHHTHVELPKKEEDIMDYYYYQWKQNNNRDILAITLQIIPFMDQKNNKDVLDLIKKRSQIDSASSVYK